MHEVRSNHGSCALDTKVYFFGGLDANQERLSSIEWIDFETNERCEQLCHPADDMKARFARELPCFVPLSNTELCIMGGLNEHGKLSDVLIFNTSSGG